MWEWRYSSTILDIGISCRCVVSFTPGPLYSRGKSPRYPSERRLGNLQSRSGHCGEDKNLAPAIQPVARRYLNCRFHIQIGSGERRARVSDWTRSLDLLLNLLTVYDWELQTTITLSLKYTLYKSLLHTISLLSLFYLHLSLLGSGF
jgi:hypothetical protein